MVVVRGAVKLAGAPVGSNMEQIYCDIHTAHVLINPRNGQRSVMSTCKMHAHLINS